MSLKHYLKKRISNNQVKPAASKKGSQPLEKVENTHGTVSKEQRTCIEYTPEGNLLVRGIPGSGKSTVLLARAKYLEEKSAGVTSKGQKVLVLAYNRALATYMGFLCRKNEMNEVESNTFHQWGLQLLGDLGISNLSCIDNKTKNDKIFFAFNIIKRNKPDTKFPKMGISNDKAEKMALVRFLSEEFSWIKGQGLTGREQYLSVARTGRGNKVQVNKTHKESIYDVFEKYNELVAQMYKIDFDDVAIKLYEKANQIPLDQRPLHILVDEAQDLTLMQLRAISKLAVKSLTIAADKGQQIYRRTFSWKAAGIDIHKGNSKFLTFTFRSTKQIIQLARSLQQHDHSLKKDDEYLPSVDPEATGPVPELMLSDSLTYEIDTVVDKVLQISEQYPQDTIGIIITSQKRMGEFSEVLEKAGIRWELAKENGADIVSPGAKLVSYYSAKGLEFDHVIVTGLKEGSMPFKNTDPDEDEADFLTRERRKLYVAMTRGKLTLTLSAVRTVSRFIDELDSSLYDRV